jgi:hypothetical protein
MNYLPIILKIPGRKYRIGIDVEHKATPLGVKIIHTICIIELFKGDNIIRHQLSVENDKNTEYKLGIKLSDYFSERLKWFYGEETLINIDELEAMFYSNRRTKDWSDYRRSFRDDTTDAFAFSFFNSQP